MRVVRSGAITLAAMLLAACGGSGGNRGVAPIAPPPPTPAPTPTPTNSSITNLTVDQSFGGPAATSDSEFNLTSGTTVRSGGAPASLSVSYNAAARSYTLVLGDRTQTFAQTDRGESPIPGEALYQKSTDQGRDRLTLVTTPYTGDTTNRYVGMGFWQRSNTANGRQTDQFTTFVYGLDTPATAMPRSGRANFEIDVFGLSTVPGFEPSVFQGQGNFNVDFLAGIFSTQTYLTEQGLLTGSGVTGGGIELVGAGRLSSGDSTFSGNVTVGGRNANLSGVLSGKFYGPGAEELGASFSATNADGATATGSFTGQRANGAPVNLTLTNMVTTQLFYAQGTALFLQTIDGRAGAHATHHPLTGQLNDRTSGNFSFGPGLSTMPGGEFTTASIVPGGDPNFTTYEKRFGERDVRLELYKVGEANRELALTFTSLGRWQSSERNNVVTERQYHHFVYGLETPARLLAARTGSASYDGIVYGAGGNRTTGAHYDVRGTSRFDVDFSNQSYSGALVLNGRNGSEAVDFGSYGFSGRLSAWAKQSAATLMHGTTGIGEIRTQFYGPGGEEIGGSFGLVVPQEVHAGGIVIGGATVARRR